MPVAVVRRGAVIRSRAVVPAIRGKSICHHKWIHQTQGQIEGFGRDTFRHMDSCMRVGVYFVASGPLVASPPLIAKPSVRPLRWSDTACRKRRRLVSRLFLELCLSGAVLVSDRLYKCKNGSQKAIFHTERVTYRGVCRVDLRLVAASVEHPRL